MKIAIATRDFATVGGHAGQARHRLLYDLARYAPGQLLPAPRQIDLSAEQVLHVFKDNAPHPLDGVDLVVAASAGDGFVRHMRTRGTDVMLTGETDPAEVITRIVSGQPLPDQRFDITTTLCKLRDLFSRH